MFFVGLGEELFGFSQNAFLQIYATVDPAPGVEYSAMLYQGNCWRTNLLV
jgi:hypothetical protein